MAAIEHTAPRALVLPEVDERDARAGLRAQIARLERELAVAWLGACPRLDPGAPLGSLHGPRVLSLGELERVRDDLAGRLATVIAAAAAQAERQAAAQAQLERMLADPPTHKWLRISNEDLGLPGCAHYHVRPRLGPIGLLCNWWRVKISSGCPLAWAA